LHNFFNTGATLIEIVQNFDHANQSLFEIWYRFGTGRREKGIIMFNYGDFVAVQLGDNGAGKKYE